MNAFRNTLLAACCAVGALPGLAAAADAAPPPPAADQQDLEKRLEAARQKLTADAREVGELSGQLGRNFAFRFGGDGDAPPRALLGIVVDSSEQKDGAHVREVSPGGAAAEAGIKAGDVITSIGGQDLTREGDPGRTLVQKMRDAEPNLKLQVGVLRDGKKLNLDVTPRPAPRQNFAFGGMPGAPGMPGMQTFQLQRGPDGPGGPGERRIEIRNFREDDDGTRFRGIEFATLSEKLGSYFGVKSGVLVVRAGANSPFKLQDGDVILAIDGRAPTSAQHAGRILRSYSPGEKLKLRIQRDRKAQDIEVTVPQGGRDEDDHDHD